MAPGGLRPRPGRIASVPPVGSSRARLRWQARRALTLIATFSLTLVLVTVPAVVASPAAQAAAPPTIGLGKTGPASVLAGSPVPFTLTATNPASAGSAVPQYNVSFQDVLPPGVTYKPGTTTPADVGDPTVFTAQVIFPAGSSTLVPQQTLVWSNVADLPIGGNVAIGYQVVPPSTLYPVGSTLTNMAQDFASTNPRLVPKFDRVTGAPKPNAATTAGPQRSVTTAISAITIVKSDDASPEGKLLRGVHQNVSIYTLLVTNNDDDPTTGNQVVDYLPANLEFLGCGTDDNSTAPEYTDSGPLGAGRTPADDCRIPTTVQTVTNPTPALTGVYTKVTWPAPDLAAGGTYTIRYAAAIPLKANTAVFPGGAPTPSSLQQGSNLDNNTGASTRQDGDGQGVTNAASVTGTYRGPTSTDPTGTTGTPVSDDDTHTVTAKDVRVLKSVQTTGDSPSKQDTFTIGGIATYTLEVDTSEYTSADDIVLTDRLPNGVCPLVPQAEWDVLVADNPTLATVQGCVAGPGQTPVNDQGTPIGYRTVTFDSATGQFSFEFTVIGHLDAESTLHVRYPTRMLATYPGGSLVGTETSAGDTFDNTADMTATSSPIPGTSESGPKTVTDSSSAELVTGGPAVQKLIRPLPVTRSTDYSCDGSDYVDPTNPVLPPARTTFALGDLVCFELRVNFAMGTYTRNAVVTDFLPDGTTFVSATAGPDNTLPPEQIALDTSGAADGTLSWNLGRTAGTARLVDPGQTFVVRVAVRITAPADPGGVDLAGNLMKLREENSAGQVVSLRHQVNFSIAPAIPLGLTKGVASINGQPDPENPADTDHQQVKQGDVVDFRVDLTHLGTAATATDRPVSSIAVWDTLPAPFTCADVTPNPGIGQECRDAADLGDWNPTVSGQSILRWTIPGPLAAGAVTRLDYTVTVPKIGPALDVVNTAYVSSYTADADDGAGAVTFHPADNIDADVPVEDQLAPAVSDSSDVFTAAAAATKTITSAIAENGNDGAGQAAVGELLTFTLGARIPAGLTVLAGSLADVLPPNGLELLNVAHPPTAALALDADNPGVTTSLPDGFSLDPTTGRLTFPASYTNNTGTDQLIVLTLTGRFTTAVGGQGDTRNDQAQFAYTPVGGNPTTVSTTATSTVVEPLPTLNKTVSPGGPYTAGQTITYQLTAGNTAGRPTAYDNWVVDCVPAGLGDVAYLSGSPSTGTADDPVRVTDAPIDGCAVGTTRIGWHVGDLAGGVSASLFYTAVIDPAAAAGQRYPNTAKLTAASIPGVRPTPSSPLPDGARGYTATDSQTVRVTVPALTKTATPDHANVGSRITFTVTAQDPADVNLYHAVVRDLLPAGFDATTLIPISVTCAQTPGTCTVPSDPPTTAPSGTGTLLTWDLGDLPAQTPIRTVTITYSAVVADVPAVKRGTPIVNGASVAWNSTPGGGVPPFDLADIAASATVTATEPVPHLAKSVSNTTPEPGQVFNYTLKFTNGGQSGDTNTGPAYNVAVKDAVPAGVIIDGTSLPAGTALSGQRPDGSGGTLTWTIPGPVAPAANVSVSYPAKLAASGTIGTAGQKNTATVTDLYSQPASGGRHTKPGTSASSTVTPDYPKVVPVKTAVTTGLAYAGVPFTWRITLANSGTGRAYNLSAADVLPVNWTYDTGSARVTTGNGSPVALEPTVTAPAGGAGPGLTWTGLAPLLSSPPTDGLAPGQSVVITLDATPGPDAPTAAGTGHPNTNRVTATTTDATGATGNAVGPYATGTGSATALIAAADLQTTKAAGTFTAGGTGTWTLTVSNNGPDAAVGPFTLTDTVPATLTLPGGGTGAALTLQSAAGTGWSCTVNTGTGAVACARTNGADTLPAGDSFPPVTVTVGIPQDAVAGSTATNAGAVGGRTFDPDPTNNTDSATGTVATEGDLKIVKTLNGVMTAGANASYTLNVSNLGPSVSLASAGSPITVTDTLPPGTDFVSAGGGGWTCAAPVAGKVTCDWTTTLAPAGNAAPLVVTVFVPADRSDAVANTATVAPGDTPDHDSLGGTNTSTVTTTPGALADLGISKVLVGKDTAPPVAGTDREYELSVTNYGPSDSQDVVVTDTLPASVKFTGTSTAVTGTWNPCTSVGQVVKCTLAGALAGPVDGTPVTARVRITVHIAATHNVADPIINTATVTASTPDPGPTSNTDTDNSLVTGEADLAIDKTITTPAVAGRLMSYQLQVRNLGPSVATGPTVVTDTLPPGLSYDPADLPSGAGWDCTLTDGVTTVTCTHAATIGTVASGLQPAAPIATPVLVAEGAVGTLTNHAAVSGPVFDPVPENDTVTRDTPIAELADVSITKTASAKTVVAGTPVSYALAVVNQGPSTARQLTVVDTPDPGLVVTGLSGPGWTCTVDTLTCTRDVLTVADGTSTITVTAHPDASVPTGTELVNNADLTVATPHTPGTPEWHGEDTITVSTLAGVSLSKKHDPAGDPVTAGDTVAFTVIAANAGPSDAVGPITIVDTLPAGMTYVSSQGPWQCAAAGQQVTCTLDITDPRIPAGGAAPELDLTVAIGSDVAAARSPTTPTSRRAHRRIPTSSPRPATPCQ